MTNHVVYLRVSTTRQQDSGLGIEAQRSAVERHLGPDATVVATYTETESGKKDSRPELRRAMDHARRAAATLVVAKVDRLARSARFLLELLDSGVEMIFCDLPAVSGPQGRFILGIMAQTAELEAGLISERTKSALQAARERGVRLGGPKGAENMHLHREKACKVSAATRKQRAQDRAELWRGELTIMLDQGMTNSQIVDDLNRRGEKSVGGGAWTCTGIRRLRQRLGLTGGRPYSVAA